MLKQFKRTTLGTLKTSGVFKLVENSRWRQRHLLVLAYHGISQADEHNWDPSLYMSSEFFAQRMQLLKDSNCTVLPLDEAIKRLYSHDLPERSVALTFDDGNYDFLTGAWPILQSFGFPVTVYLSTFYSLYRKPVFDVICSYLVWKGQKQRLDFSKITGQQMIVDLSGTGSLDHAVSELLKFARDRDISAEEKDALACKLANALGIDYDAVIAQRLLQLLSPTEVKNLASEGVDIQLHTHRHSVPSERSLFLREIKDNQKSIQQMTGKVASHFCYPSGFYRPSFLPWLEEAGVVSATTCDVGFASRESHPLLLPRLLDGSGLSNIEFEGWLTGVSAALPRRRKVV